MTIIIGARDARLWFAELMGRVGNEKEVAIIERFGKPLVALILGFPRFSGHQKFPDRVH